MMERLGLSGDTIIIEDEFVLKICETNQDRFIKNIAKQMEFNNPYITAVPIIEEGIIDDKNYIKMPRLKCDNCIVWISKVGLELVNVFIERIEQYLSNLIENSQLKEFDYIVWNNKIEELEKRITNNNLLNALSYLKSMKFNNKFYYCECHGDFSLCNLFISNDGDKLSIDAIDFLDTFISSPIQDITKLRQDCFHFWTINLMTNFSKVDHNRVMIMLGYIDRRIEKMIQSNIILSEYYVPFQILNLLRIVPYTNNERILKYLEKEIEGLL